MYFFCLITVTPAPDDKIRSSIFASRRSTINARSRDVKLPSVLYNRHRRITNRWKSYEECEKKCREISNEDYCRMNCNRSMKFLRNESSDSMTVSESSIPSEQSTHDSNLILPSNADEFLDTEESVHGIFIVDPNNVNNNRNSSNYSNQTKEISSMMINNINEKIDAAKKNNRKEKNSIEISTIATASSISKINRRKYTRTSLLPTNQTRPTVYRGRVRYSPSSLKTLEESEDPYLHLSQKLESTSRIPEMRKTINNKRTSSYQSTTPSKSKEEELEIMEISVAKKSSTEKSKFWKARSVIGINNYMRRFSPHLNVLSTVPRGFENTTASAKSVKYEIVREETKTSQSTIVSSTSTTEASVSTTEGDKITKNISLKANSSNYHRASPTKTIYRPAHMSLIINVPDDASPVFYNDNRSYQQSDGEFESIPPPRDTFEYTTTSYDDKTSSRDFVSVIPDINHLFENITTMTPINSVTVQSEIPVASTTKSLSSSTNSVATESYTPGKTTKKIYTTIPRRKSLTTTLSATQNIISSTISSFLNNVSSKRDKINIQAETDVITKKTPSLLPTIAIITTSTTKSPQTTISYTTISKIESKTSVPTSIEVVAPPSMTPVTTSNRPITIYEAISTTSKTHTNEVFVEAQQTNTSTYVFGILGLLPLIVILLYVIKQYMYKREHKDGDIETYGNDIQPISPVVTLNHSEDGTCSEGDESIISESDFNRNKLRFKSLLGEGNFGQVWKAEIDDLPGFIGTTKIVAVKTERINNGQGGLKAECEIMRKLGSHSNVVTLLAACTERGMRLFKVANFFFLYVFKHYFFFYSLIRTAFANYGICHEGKIIIVAEDCSWCFKRFTSQYAQSSTCYATFTETINWFRARHCERNGIHIREKSN